MATKKQNNNTSASTAPQTTVEQTATTDTKSATVTSASTETKEKKPGVVARVASALKGATAAAPEQEKKPADAPKAEEKVTETAAGSPPDPDFRRLKTVEELVECYCDMVPTAIDLGIPKIGTVKSFPDVKTGVLACERLHFQIKKARDPKSVKKEEEVMAKKASKKTTSKNASKIKKGGAKKGAAKKATGVKRPRASFDENAKITWLYSGENGKNPCRDGSGKAKRVDGVIKASGKTVKTFLAGGGLARSLAHCVGKKWCKVG